MYGIYVTTSVGIIATALQVIFTRIVRRKFDTQQLITLLVFTVFGGLTLYFHNPIFVKWKPTTVFWVFGLAFFISQFVGKKPIIQRMFEGLLEKQDSKKPEIPARIWKRLTLAWTLFFITLGALNLGVAYSFSTEIWVNFKVYGILGLIMLFSFVQALCLARYLSE